jgi:uncharacterized membrane protein YphA (DoxX/SURF4 family)
MGMIWAANVPGLRLQWLGIFLLLCSLFVIAGFVTRVVQVSVFAIVVGVVGYRLLMVQDPTSVYDWQIWAFEMATAVSLTLIGPGRYSIDARLFGRREIVFEASTNC